MDRKTAIIGFRKYFNSNNIFQDFSVSALTGKYELDIIGLDRWCHEVHGYMEDAHGSLKDFINFKFGKDARKFIMSCLCWGGGNTAQKYTGPIIRVKRRQADNMQR